MKYDETLISIGDMDLDKAAGQKGKKRIGRSLIMRSVEGMEVGESEERMIGVGLRTL